MISKRFFEEVFVGEIYKPVRELGQLDVVIDLGACTGEFVLWQQQRSNRVYAIEGHKELFTSLKENLSDFNNTSTHNVALADWNGSGYMVGGLDGGAKLVHEKVDNSIKVPVVTLATFMKQNGIDRVNCLKVDIEDGEKRVFESADFKSVAENIDFIIGEHVFNMAGERLKELGFKAQNSGEYFIR